MKRRQRAVAATSNETPGDAYGGTLASDNDNGRVLGVCRPQQGAALDSGAERDSAAGVVTGTGPLLGKSDVLGTMSVYDESAPAGTASDEVVACVADDESEVVVPRKVDTGFDVFLLGRPNDIDTVVA